jgi:hypothetical protein
MLLRNGSYQRADQDKVCLKLSGKNNFAAKKAGYGQMKIVPVNAQRKWCGLMMSIHRQTSLDKTVAGLSHLLSENTEAFTAGIFIRDKLTAQQLLYCR